MENKNNFLLQKYPDIAGSRPVERATDKARESGEKIHDNAERVDAYMNRLERVLGKEGKFDKEKGFHLLKNKILNNFTLGIDDPEIVEKVAEGLYESEKRIAVERGQGNNIRKFNSIQEVVENYGPIVQEKAEIQKKTLASWLDYLEQNDAKHPMWFRYFIVRSLEKMGNFNKERADYSKRTATTVALFPELNSEALGWVFQKFTQNLGEVEDFDLQDPNAKQKKQALEKFVQKKDFAKLYAFALVETSGRLNKESIEGEWRKYDQGSDYTILEQDLKGKGTGWCTATGSASAHLQGGDFHVFYTKNSNGTYTEPRIAIRMDGEQIREVRGVNHRQELEPDLVDIAQAKYHNLPGGESYDKKAQDMKEVTILVKKQEKGEPFNKDDLIFLYEINSKIEGFGYDNDPRIAELRNQRKSKLKEDMATVFECQPEQIAYTENEITENTKAYVGPLFENIFQTNIEHIYFSFPEGRIEKIELGIGGQTKDELKREIKEKFKLSSYAENMLGNSDFEKQLYENPDAPREQWILKKPEQLKLVRLKVADLGFTKNPTTDELYARAQELGLEICPAEVGPQLRLKYNEVFKREQPMNEYLRIAMKQIAGSDDDPSIFSVRRREDGLWLGGDWADPGIKWNLGGEFVFRLRKTES